MSDPKKFPPIIAAPVDDPVVARVGFLGPKGTFSHIATLAHFGVGVN